MSQGTYYKAVRIQDDLGDGIKRIVTGQNITVDDDPGTISCFASLKLAVEYQAIPASPADYCEVFPVDVNAEDPEIIECRRLTVGKFLTPKEIYRLVGFRLWELSRPVNPLTLTPSIPIDAAVTQLRDWAKVQAHVKANLEAIYYVEEVQESILGTLSGSEWDSMLVTIEGLVKASRLDSIGEKVVQAVSAAAGGFAGDRAGTSVKEELLASMDDSVWAYVGGLFPRVDKWKYARALGRNPWRPLLTLWYAGYVPSFDGTRWRLHTGAEANIVWEGIIEAGQA